MPRPVLALSTVEGSFFFFAVTVWFKCRALCWPSTTEGSLLCCCSLVVLEIKQCFAMYIF